MTLDSILYRTEEFVRLIILEGNKSANRGDKEEKDESRSAKKPEVSLDNKTNYSL